MLDHTRHSGIFDAENIHILLIGVGGIGSMAALVLAKMGVGSLAIVDPDSVDEVNVATQLHGSVMLGEPKVVSTAIALSDYADFYASEYAETFTNGADSTKRKPNVIISAVDSIEARKDIWNVIQDMPDWKYYIDARMGAESFHCYVVDRGTPEWYDHIVINSNEDDVPDLPCTEKATFYTAAIAGGMLGHIVKQIATDDVPPGRLVFDINYNVLTVM